MTFRKIIEGVEVVIKAIAAGKSVKGQIDYEKKLLAEEKNKNASANQCSAAPSSKQADRSCGTGQQGTANDQAHDTCNTARVTQ